MYFITCFSDFEYSIKFFSESGHTLSSTLMVWRGVFANMPVSAGGPVSTCTHSLASLWLLKDSTLSSGAFVLEESIKGSGDVLTATQADFLDLLALRPRQEAEPLMDSHL